MENHNPEILLQILDTVSEPTSVVTDKYQYIYVNQAYSDFLGYPKEEIKGKYVWEITGKENFNSIVKGHLDKALKGTKAEYLNSVELRGVNPHLQHLQMIYYPLKTHKPTDRQYYLPPEMLRRKNILKRTGKTRLMQFRM